jgi:hypothetical protein
MVRFCRPKSASYAQFRIMAGAVAALLFVASGAPAAVMVAGDPATNYGTDPNIFTVDPFAPEVTGIADRGITQDRRLRQTFKNPTTFNVGEIIVSFDVTGAPEVGLGLRVYEVDDVNAGSWTAGTLIKEITVFDTLPASDMNMSFALTGGDVFSLPARFAGTTGYGIEISTPLADPTSGNPGTLHYTNVSGMDFYLDGRHYNEGGGGVSTRDIGLSFLASDEVACDPGDVNCMDGVDLIDLEIIAAHFRQGGSRDDGDLTGNGFIDFDDFGQWKEHYTGPALGADAFEFLTVPEPVSIGLMLCGAVGLLAAIGGRRRWAASGSSKSAM